ncbi:MULTISPECIES: helix-turn-helix transcriptional regulator [unclassified Saccharothrix]|uniref:helix-turn-helix transcriptional regulator n=1 Tax=unclassified Saccharothrix TaxID=2593673 RepID=UPI00307EFBD3
MDRRAELGEFLRSRRARLRPEELGLADHGRRRVPGLRREEPARLAGVSVDHYVRLEQGRTLHFSEAVLDAVARALRLDEVERAHLHRLARPWTPSTDAPAPQQVRPGLQRLLDLAAELSAASREFAAVWAEHGLKDKTHGHYRYLHPVVGELDLGFESLRLPDEPDQVLIAHTFEEGSPAETKLRLLSAWEAVGA